MITLRNYEILIDTKLSEYDALKTITFYSIDKGINWKITRCLKNTKNINISQCEVKVLSC